MSARYRPVVLGFVLAFLCCSAEMFAQPGRIPNSFAEVAKKVEPAVVSIGTPAPGDSDDIMDFFRRQLPQRPVYAVGSGFIVDKTGYIITNGHVIDNAARITVKLDSGEEYTARVVGTDDETDLAILYSTFHEGADYSRHHGRVLEHHRRLR